MNTNIQIKRNRFGLQVKMCCASCQFKDLTRASSQRWCNNQEKSVKSSSLCGLWQMNQQLKMAGMSKGGVKRKEYLMFVLATHLREDEAKERGEEVVPMSLADIREEFEAKYGDIYVEI